VILIFAAWEKAFATDKQAPFGASLFAIARSMSRSPKLQRNFQRGNYAPEFSGEARTILQRKKICASFGCWLLSELLAKKDVRSVCGGLLVQDPDTCAEDKERVVQNASHSTNWKRCGLAGGGKHVKSNAIVYSASDRTLAIGAGQMSRVDSSRVAIWKAQEAGLSSRVAPLPATRFSPFADGLIAAADARCDLRRSAGRINARRRGNRGCRRTRDWQ